MRVVVEKWGDSASVRIPAAVMQAARLEIDQTVDVREEEGRIVIEPVRGEDEDLASLVARITPENLHEPVDFGRPVGKDVW
jgi:antitoxin MazE